jgi:folate-binding Fe-S cluster repair protein YgfZ
VRTTFNLIIKDKSGNELWLSVSEEQLPRLSEDLTMQDVLSMYDLEPVKQSNAFFSWLNARPRSRKEHIRTYRAQ